MTTGPKTSADDTASTHGSGSNMSFFFFSNWSFDIILEREEAKYRSFRQSLQ